MPNPDATIVVIAFNEEPSIQASIGALLAQATTRTFEVIVIDDASTDRTAAVVEEIAARDQRVRVLRHSTNRGRGAARRTGQDAAASAMVGYVDADVIVPADWLERCAAALDAGHAAVSGIASPDGDCVVLSRILDPVVRVRRHSMAISGGNVLFRASALQAVGFDEQARLGEDFRLAKRMAAGGFSLITLPDLVAEHRERKSYAQTVRWMWHNGVDASRLPFEFGSIRTPDLTWLGWLFTALMLVGLAVLGRIKWSTALGAAVFATAGIAGSHAASRFRVRPRTTRFAGAVVLDVPLIGAYLAGRTAGLPSAVISSRKGSDKV